MHMLPVYLDSPMFCINTEKYMYVWVYKFNNIKEYMTRLFEHIIYHQQSNTRQHVYVQVNSTIATTGITVKLQAWLFVIVIILEQAHIHKYVRILKNRPTGDVNFLKKIIKELLLDIKTS